MSALPVRQVMGVLTTMARIISHIRAADPRYDTPLSVSPRATLRDVQGIIRKRSHDLVVVDRHVTFAVDESALARDTVGPHDQLGAESLGRLHTADVLTVQDRVAAAK